MTIYTSNANGNKLKEVGRLGMGMLLVANPSKISETYRHYTTALDNGAFQYWKRGLPFIEEPFLESIRKVAEKGLSLEFIVVPDIVAGGKESLAFSTEWILGNLRTAPRLALAVQDGMEPSDVKNAGILRKLTHIFVGGTPEWKWAVASEWVDFAHDEGKKCHIGRCGTLDKLQRANRIGADSVDSNMFVRYDNWHIVDEFLNPGQMELPMDEARKERDAIPE